MPAPTRPPRPLSADEVTIATRTLLDHIDNHKLPLPSAIYLPGPYAAPEDRCLTVGVYSWDLEVWHDSIWAAAEGEQITASTSGWVTSSLDGTLPVSGVRVRIRASVPQAVATDG